jgi:hypothetical protein
VNLIWTKERASQKWSPVGSRHKLFDNHRISNTQICVDIFRTVLLDYAFSDYGLHHISTRDIWSGSGHMPPTHPNIQKFCLPTVLVTFRIWWIISIEANYYQLSFSKVLKLVSGSKWCYISIIAWQFCRLYHPLLKLAFLPLHNPLTMFPDFPVIQLSDPLLRM